MERRRAAFGAPVAVVALLLVSCSGDQSETAEGVAETVAPTRSPSSTEQGATPATHATTQPPPAPEPVPAPTAAPAAPVAAEPAPAAAPPRKTTAPSPTPRRSPSPVSAPTTPPATTQAPAPAPAARALTIESFAFSPQTMTIDVGTTVTATNKDAARHTWTADDGSWDSGSLAQDASFSFTFRRAGTFSFYCRPHPTMTGSVTVR